MSAPISLCGSGRRACPFRLFRPSRPFRPFQEARP